MLNTDYPIFRGYNVVYRLEQFQKIRPGTFQMEIIDFADERGAQMLMAWLKEQPGRALEEITRWSKWRGYIRLEEHFYISFAQGSLKKKLLKRRLGR